jgi:hypothetical protein
MPPDPRPTLEYDRDAKPYITRRSYRVLLLLTILNTIMIGGFLAGPAASNLAQQTWAKWQAHAAQRAQEQQRKAYREKSLATYKQCAQYTFPKDTLIYTEAPDEALRLISDASGFASIPSGNVRPPIGWQSPVIGPAPAALQPFVKDSGTVFIHERESANGQRALVVVSFYAEQLFSVRPNGNLGIEKRRELHGQRFGVLDDGDIEAKPFSVLQLFLPDSDVNEFATRTSHNPVRWAFKNENHLRVFGGHADPDDRSHFTIPYELDGTPGVIDGWLGDDGVKFRPRAGRAEYTGGSPRWNLTAPTTATSPTH